MNKFSFFKVDYDSFECCVRTEQSILATSCSTFNCFDQYLNDFFIIFFQGAIERSLWSLSHIQIVNSRISFHLLNVSSVDSKFYNLNVLILTLLWTSKSPPPVNIVSMIRGLPSLIAICNEVLPRYKVKIMNYTISYYLLHFAIYWSLFNEIKLQSVLLQNLTDFSMAEYLRKINF